MTFPEQQPISHRTGLADATDLVTYGYSADASGHLARAEARVKAYVRQQIVAGTSTVTLTYPFLLPERPAIAISAITVEPMNSLDTISTLTSSDYELRGQYVHVPSVWKGSRLTVTYTHGFTTIPDELVEVVCSIANRMYRAPAGMVAGIQSESADGESISYGADSFAGVTELTSAEKRVLDRIFPHSRKVPQPITTL